jgi:DNA-binding MarR family transcriptional regulator
MDRPLNKFVHEMAEFMPKYIGEAHARFNVTSLMKDITFTQMVILNFLKACERAKMSEIAKALKVTTSATTGIVDRMVRTGFLVRVPGMKDRRIIYIEMTEKGEKIVDAIEKQRRKFINGIFGKLTTTEREKFLQTMKKIYKIMREGRP